MFERKGLPVQQVFGLFKWKTPTTTPLYPLTHPRDSVWIGAGSFVSAFILVLTECERLKEHMQGYQRVQGDPPYPPPPNGTTRGGELVTDPPIHGFILQQQNAFGVA